MTGTRIRSLVIGMSDAARLVLQSSRVCIVAGVVLGVDCSGILVGGFGDSMMNSAESRFLGVRMV